MKHLMWRVFVSAVVAAVTVVAAGEDGQEYRVKRQIYYPNFDYEDLEYQPRDHVSAANTGHLPIAPHYPADPYQSNSYKPPGPDKPHGPAYNPIDVPYQPPASVYKPTPAPYKPPVTAYKPTPAPYKPPAPAYKPTPAPYKPPAVAYKPTPSPYKPPAVAYKPTPAPYKPAPAYKPSPAPYKPPSHAYKPKPVYQEPSHHEPEHKPYKEKNSIPGVAGQDYPIYNKIPYTKFSCQDVPYRPGMYANPEAGCQVYHVCDDDRYGSQGASFLCTNGTLFNQETFNCDWWYNVDCSKATYLYELNTDPDHNPYYQKPYEGPLHVPKYIHQDAYEIPEPTYNAPKSVYHADAPKPSIHAPTHLYKPAPKPTYHVPVTKPKRTYHAPVTKPKPTYHSPPSRPHKPAPKPTYHSPKPRPTYHTPAPTYKPNPKPTYHLPAPKPNYHKPAPIHESTEPNYKPRPWKAPAYKPPTTYHNKRETEDKIGFVAADEATDFAWGDKI